MRILIAMITLAAAGWLTLSDAQAACTGTNGRGWGTGRGAGQFQMTTADKSCRISHPGIVNDRAGTRIVANQVSITRAPSSGKLAVSSGGIVYTPNKGFKGSDSFCTSNTTPKAPGEVLAGCVTIMVQ
ncbi:Ig-like domain-containing protein [Bosea sp. (in: a-proteobacteria)]|uniref:Ig-like domain-containing protein n=1 Tax=Bosea sp. (in: a-proteobacteria) TaxID=1871050 RepID=UPI0026177890|nr:Ig-like domain-containing protein [Bosea sp. (in: a-proteobacteria)]MCO5092840.1 Ig-like domain-containing protein [Bosea sp. (in: a-proteobacteria)]